MKSTVLPSDTPNPLQKPTLYRAECLGPYHGQFQRTKKNSVSHCCSWWQEILSVKFAIKRNKSIQHLGFFFYRIRRGGVHPWFHVVYIFLSPSLLGNKSTATLWTPAYFSKKRTWIWERIGIRYKMIIAILGGIIQNVDIQKKKRRCGLWTTTYNIFRILFIDHHDASKISQNVKWKFGMTIQDLVLEWMINVNSNRLKFLVRHRVV